MKVMIAEITDKSNQASVFSLFSVSLPRFHVILPNFHTQIIIADIISHRTNHWSTHWWFTGTPRAEFLSIPIAVLVRLPIQLALFCGCVICCGIRRVSVLQYERGSSHWQCPMKDSCIYANGNEYCVDHAKPAQQRRRRRSS